MRVSDPANLANRTVFRIRDILVRIRMRTLGSVPLTDPDADPDPALFGSDLQDANKNKFFAHSFLNVYLHDSLKIKVMKKSQNSRNHGCA